MDSTKIEDIKKYFNDFGAVLKSTLDVDRLSDVIDKNIALVRYLPYAVGGLGIIVIFRSVKLATKFTQVGKIPESFIRKNIDLKGIIKTVEIDGTIQVEHLPIIRLPWHPLYKNSFLNVRLAFTPPNVSGIYWMNLNVKGRPIKFTPLQRNNDELFAFVQTIGGKPKISGTLNEILVSKGFAQVEVPSNFQMAELSSMKQIAKQIARLKEQEKLARSQGKGMWFIDHRESILEKSYGYFKNTVNKLVTRNRN